MAITFVQKSANHGEDGGGPGSATNVATITGVTAGNWLIAVGWGANTTNNTSSMTTPSGWTLASQGAGNSDGTAAVNNAVYFKKSTAGGTETCTFNFVASDAYSEAAIIEVSAPGGLTLGPVAHTGGNGVATGTVGPTSTTGAAALVVAVGNMLNISFTATGLSAASSGYTTIYNDPTGAVYTPGDSAYKLVASGTQQALWAWTNNAAWTGSIATFTEGSTGTNLTPGALSLAISGYAPTLAQPQGVTPGALALTLTGYAPTLAQPRGVAPGALALALTGYAPTLAQPKALSPGQAAIALTGYAPTVTQGAGLNLTPGALSLALTGYAPTLAQPHGLAPGALALALTGYAPTVGQTAAGAISPGALSLTLAGYAPTLTQTASQSVSPPAAGLTLVGYAPTLAQPRGVAPNVAALVVSGFAPAILRTANQALPPAPAVIALTGYAPTVSQSANVVRSPGAAVLTITGYAPAVEQRGPYVWEYSPRVLLMMADNRVVTMEPAQRVIQKQPSKRTIPPEL